MAVPVAVIEMVGLRIVIVDRQFDESQAENASVEIQILLRVARDRRDMMDAQNFSAHTRVSSFSLQSWPSHRPQSHCLRKHDVQRRLHAGAGEAFEELFPAGLSLHWRGPNAAELRAHEAAGGAMAGSSDP